MGQRGRLGLIGYGLAGSAFHAPIIATTDGLELAAIVTSDAERAAGAQARYPTTMIVDSVDDLWAMSLDGVVIATPNATHAGLGHEAISRGVAAIVDKPIALSSDDGEGLVDAAERAQVPLTVFQNRRWDGDFLTVQELVNSGSLGTVARFESRFERWRPGLAVGDPEYQKALDRGGIIFDLGSHVIDQAINLFGPVENIYAEVDATRANSPVDDDTFVALTHANGVRSHLYVSAVAADLGPRFRVLGTEAAYVTYGLDVQEAALRAGEIPGLGWGAVPEADWGVRSGDGDPQRVPTVPGNYPAFYAQVASALIDGAPMPVDPRDALTTLRIIEAARTASNERRIVSF